MKILFNFEPMILCEEFFPSFNLFYRSILKNNTFEYLSKVHDCRFLVSERVFYQAQVKRIKLKNTICIYDIEYFKCLDVDYLSHYDVSELFYKGNLDESCINRFSSLFNEKFSDWTPDIIISFEMYNKLYDYIFPNSLQLVYSGGIFKREVLPNTVTFDPCGSSAYSFCNIFKEQINNIKITQEENDIINNLKFKLKYAIRTNSKMKKKINVYRKKFDYLLLLPMLFSRHYAFDTETQFHNQWDLLTYVMEHVPKNVGVIVTEHDHNKFISGGILEKGGFLDWYKGKYKNFIYLEDEKIRHNKFCAASLYILPEVDGVINISSTVGILGVLFDKKIISIGEHSNDYYKDTQGLKDICEVLRKPLKDKNCLLYWLLTRYNIFLNQFGTFEWFNNYLSEKLEKYRKEGLNFDFFSENMSIKDVSDYVIESIKKYYSCSIPPSPFKVKMSKAKKPGNKFSIDDIQIFVATHNRAEYLKESLESILNQTANVSEITVLDNESTDDTETVAASFSQRGVKYVKTRGFLGNYKKAKELADKKYLMIFHDDDLLHPKYLEMALNILNTHDDISLITTRYTTFKDNDFLDLKMDLNINLNPCYYLFEKASDYAAFMYYKEWISYASAIYRTKDFIKNDLEYEKYSKFNDWPFIVKIADCGKSVLLADSKVFYARIHPCQDTETFENVPSIQQLINWDKFFYEKLSANNIFSPMHYLFINKFKYFFLGMCSRFLPENVKSQMSEKALLNLAAKSGIKINGLPILYSLFTQKDIKRYFTEKYINTYKKYSI